MERLTQDHQHLDQTDSIKKKRWLYSCFCFCLFVVVFFCCCLFFFLFVLFCFVFETEKKAYVLLWQRKNDSKLTHKIIEHMENKYGVQKKNLQGYIFICIFLNFVTTWLEAN